MFDRRDVVGRVRLRDERSELVEVDDRVVRERGVGVALEGTPARDGVESELREGSVQEIATPFTPLERQWHLVGARDRETRRGVEEFVRFATELGGFVAAAV